MKYLQSILLFVAIGSVMASCEKITVDENCTEGESLCENDFLYTCVKDNKDKFFKVISICLYGCDLNTNACKQDENCKSEKFNADGSCDMNCLLGTNKDGTCINSTNCATQSWNFDGSCKCPDECEDNCNEAGICNTKQCSNGYKSDGTCFCPEECASGCTEEGECKCPEGCPNGCDNDWKTCCDTNCNHGCYDAGRCRCDSSCENNCNLNGDCCLEQCKNGCDVSKNCLCEPTCLFGCDEVGNCKQDSQCKQGWNDDGSCYCPETCELGCLNNGSCHKEYSCENDEACKTVDYCNGSECYCNDENICKLKDGNRNHLMDSEEVGSQLGKSCRVDADCGENGFCDSFLNYICSVRCTKDSQCVDSAADDFHYICRPDGRCAPDAFVTVWKTEKANTTVQLPTSDKCQFHINWGDGQEEDITNCSNAMALQHTYRSANQYTITLSKNNSGKFEYPNFSLCKHSSVDTSYEPINKNVNSLLTGILAFGPVGLGPGAFCACSNLTQLSTVDIPDATQMTSMYGMFSYSDFNRNIENWDVSHVTTLRYLFHTNPKFNQPLNRWDVSNVTNMIGVFAHATGFNQPLNDWDVSSVTDMTALFYDAAIFNQPLGKWNVSNVNNMSRVFHNALKFNQNINTWKTSNVTNIYRIFANAVNYNQPLYSWDVSNVTNMAEAFFMALKFDQDLSSWNVSKVTNMYKMFRGAATFNKPLNGWDVSNVTDMAYMFSNSGKYTDGKLNKGYTSKFNQPLNKWKVANVKDMTNMFDLAESFNQNLADWKVKSAAITNIFWRATKLSKDNYCKTYKAWSKKPAAPSSDKKYKNCT